MKILRTIGRWAVLSTATVWLGLNAIHILALTFGWPDVPRWWPMWLSNNPWRPWALAWLKSHAWPWISLMLVVVLRQETHRWFSVRRGRRSADRLIIGWFVFVGTLLLIDWLEPMVHVVWSPIAIETSLWLVGLCAVMWVSRLVHSTTRRRLRMIVKRWHLVGLWSAVTHRGSSLGHTQQGVRRYAQQPHTKRRVR